MAEALPAPVFYSRVAGDPDDAWEIVTNPVTMQPGVETEFVCVGPSATTSKTWDSTAEQELVRIQEIYDTAGGTFFVADDANLFEDSAANIAASVNGVMGCWLDSSQSGTVQGRRNLLTYSEDFRNTAAAGETRPWVATAVTPGSSLELIPGPFGESVLATKLTETTDNSVHIARQSLSTTVGVTNAYVSTFLVKRAVGTRNILVQGNNGAAVAAAAINLETGVVTAPSASHPYSGISCSTRALQNGWYEVTLTYTLIQTATNSLIIYIVNEGVATYAGDGASSIYLYRAQHELGSEPTPYQKIITGTADLVPGAHAYQNVTANKPYKRRTPTTGLNWADSNTATAALNVTFNAALGSTCTVARVGPDGVTFDENVTIGTSYNIAPAYGWNGDVAIIDRALTATEKALFTRFMLRHKPGLGAELVVNGTFDTDLSGWASEFGATASWDAGKIKIVNPGTTGSRTIQQHVMNGQYYGSAEIAADTGTMMVRAGQAVAPFNTLASMNRIGSAMGLVKMAFVSPEQLVALQLRPYSSIVGQVCLADNVSLKEII